MTPASRTARLLPLGALVLAAGCGSQGGRASTEPAPSSPTSTTSTTATKEPSGSASATPVKPASGPRLRADGVSFRVPKGWADVTEETSGTVLLAADLGADERPDMIRVERLAGSQTSASQLRRAAQAALAQDYRQVRLQAPTRVGGAPAVHLSAVSDAPGEHAAIDRFDVATPTGTWAVTFSLNRWVVPKDRERLIGSVLETFVWK